MEPNNSVKIETGNKPMKDLQKGFYMNKYPNRQKLRTLNKKKSETPKLTKELQFLVGRKWYSHKNLPDAIKRDIVAQLACKTRLVTKSPLISNNKKRKSK